MDLMELSTFPSRPLEFQAGFGKGRWADTASCSQPGSGLNFVPSQTLTKVQTGKQGLSWAEEKTSLQSLTVLGLFQED